MLRHLCVAVMLCTIAVTSFAQEKRPVRKRHNVPASGNAVLQWKVDSARAVNVTVGDVVLPYIVDGGGYRTTIRLTNLETRDVTVEIFFIGDDGEPASVAISGRKVGGLRGTIPALGMITVQTEGGAEESQISWSFFSAGEARVAATVTIDGKSGETWRGSTYPASSFIAKKVIAPFDHADNSDSQISVANVSAGEVVVTAIVRAFDGKELFKEDITLGPLNAIGYYPLDVVPDLAGRRGTWNLQFQLPLAVVSVFSRRGSMKQAVSTTSRP
jgi:hypothetical protein